VPTVPAPRDSRLARAAACAALTVPLGSAAHVLAGREAPEAGTTLVLFALVMAGTSVALRRPPSPGRIVAVVVLAQLVVHLVLSTVAVASSGSMAPPAPVAVVHHGHSATMHASDGSWEMLAAHVTSGLTSAAGLAMTCLHVVAALLVGLLIARGDQALRTLLNLRRSLAVAAGLRAALVVGARALAARALLVEVLARLARLALDHPRPRQTPWLETARRRGPPTALAL
jgi:hypothetical protein